MNIQHSFIFPKDSIKNTKKPNFEEIHNQANLLKNCINKRENNMEYLMNEMIEKNADGIDFIDFKDFIENSKQPTIIVSYSLEQIQNKEYDFYPKTPYKFWMLKDGKKVYINE